MADIPVLSGAELKRRRKKHRELLDVAIPFMEDLHRLVSGSGFLILLSDPESIYQACAKGKMMCWNWPIIS